MNFYRGFLRNCPAALLALQAESVVVNNFFQAARLASLEAWKRGSLVSSFGWGAATSQTMGKTWRLRIYFTGGHADKLSAAIKKQDLAHV